MILLLFSTLNLAALDSLGFGTYKDDAMAVLAEAKAVAAKKRKGSSRLENLGIPEEELLRQQQELFAKVRVLKNHSCFKSVFFLFLVQAILSSIPVFPFPIISFFLVHSTKL